LLYDFSALVDEVVGNYFFSLSRFDLGEQARIIKVMFSR
jgi:hypothetical protein